MPRDRRQKRAKKTLPQGKRFIRYSQTFNLSPPLLPIHVIGPPNFIRHERVYIYELPRKYPQEKILDPQNTNEKKYWTQEIPTTKNCVPTKYQPA